MWTGIEGRLSGQSFLPLSIKQLGETKAGPGQVEKPVHLLSRPVALFFKRCSQCEGFREAMISGLESLRRAGLIFFQSPKAMGLGPSLV
jgi:hypothetical protein